MMKKVFAVSILAIMAVATADAEIVSQENIVGTNGITVSVPKAGETNAGKVQISGPTLPTVNDATLTIQQNGTAVATFTANSGTAATANITVPTQTSDLTNDSGFLTAHQDISGKMDKTVAGDSNGVVVRNSAGTAMKGTGTDITVSDAGAITVAHATSADSATTATNARNIPSGSQNSTTFAAIWVE